MPDTNSTEFIADPAGHVLAVIDDEAMADHAAADLEAGGHEEVRVYHGRKGAEAIDADGTQHGIAEHIVRLVQQGLTNKDSLAEYEREVLNGACVLSFRVAGADGSREQALAVLEQARARAINSYGAAVVETLKP